MISFLVIPVIPIFVDADSVTIVSGRTQNTVYILSAIPTIYDIIPEKILIQQDIEKTISKIPYVASIVNGLNIIDYAVIGSIVLVMIIVISCIARKKSEKLALKKYKQD